MQNKNNTLQAEAPIQSSSAMKPTDIVEFTPTVDPKKEVAKAVEASKVLMDIVNKTKKKVIITVNNNDYLMFPAWQTLARFYGFMAQTAEGSVKRMVDKDNKFMGYTARSVVVNLRNGMVLPGADARCLTTELNWRSKPEFTLASMAQTRACSKALSNMFRWVAALAGYEGTPAEEMVDAVVVSKGEGKEASSKQLFQINRSFTWKKLDKADFENKYKPVAELNSEEASVLLDFFIKNKKVTQEQLYDLLKIKDKPATVEEAEVSSEPDPTASWPDPNKPAEPAK